LDSVGLKDSDRRRFLEFAAAKRLEESRQVKDPYTLGALGFTLSAAPSTPPKSLIRPISSVSSRGREGSRESLDKLEPTSPGVHTPIQLRKMAEQQRKLQKQRLGMVASEARSHDKRNLPMPPPHSASAPRFDPLAFHRNLLAQQQQNSPQKQEHRIHYGDDSRGNETLSKGGASLNSSWNKSQQHSHTMNGDDSRGNETLSKGNGSLGFSGKLRQGGAHTSNSISRSMGNSSLGFSGQLGQGGAHRPDSVSRSVRLPVKLDSFSPEKLEESFDEVGLETVRGPSMSMARGSLRDNDSAVGSTSRSTLSGFGVPLRGAPPPPEPLPSRLADRMKEQVKRSGEQAYKFEQARYSMDRSKLADAHAVAVVTNRGVSSSSSRAHVVHSHKAKFRPSSLPPPRSQAKRSRESNALNFSTKPSRTIMDDISDLVGFRL